MKEVRAKVFDNIAEIIDEMRGSEPRTDFLRRVISRGLKELHAEGTRNAPSNDWSACQKQEGQMSYLTRTFADHMGEVFHRARNSLTI